MCVSGGGGGVNGRNGSWLRLLKQQHLLLPLREMSQSHDLCGQQINGDVVIPWFSYLDC